MQRLSFLRALGNYGLMVNTMFGLYFHMQTGLYVGLVFSSFCLPFYIKTKMWDTVIFIAFMSVINLGAAVSGVPGCK
jgi:hypothetical protein